MSLLSVTCTALFSAACAFTLVTAAGCGTDAKGIEDCRDIEQTRCVAAKACGQISDVAECQRYYRDQCLHGLPVNQPKSTQVKACVATIRAAGVCASRGVEAALLDCPDVTLDAPGVQTACELVATPEKAVECVFLTAGSDAGTAGGGGASASAASSEDAGAGAGGT